MDTPTRRSVTAGFGSVLLAGAAPAGVLAQGRSPSLPMAASPESLGFSSARLERLNGAMAKAIATDRKAGGMITLLARHGKIAQLKIHGERAPGQPMTRDAIFRIYSMTKPITGAAMMILYEENRWRLDDPVTRFIPEFANLKVVTGVDASGQPVLVPARRPPTMREVMSHTAGFAYATDPKDPADKIFIDKGVMQADGLKQMIQRLAEVPLIFQPGDRWWYSAAVDVQGYLVESISGMKFSDFLKSRVFEPLKMPDTGFWVPPEKAGRLATMWEDDPASHTVKPMAARNGQPLPDATKPPALESGGGGLYSTIDDYARFAQMINNKGELDGVRLLSPAAVELMGHNVVSKSALEQRTYFNSFHESVGFGLDFMIVMDPREAGRLEGQGTMSWEGAAGTWFWSDPANGVVFVGMVQNLAYTGPRGYDPPSRPLVYQALVDPSR